MSHGTPLTDSQGKPVFDLEIDGERDGHDFFGYVTSAVYDDGSPVPDDELDYLTDTYPDYVASEAFQSAIMAAEYACEGDR